MSQQTCSKCGTICGPTARFCSRCRNPLRKRQKLTCPKGHRMDPSWSECPFCRSSEPPAPNPLMERQPARVSRSRTMVEGVTPNLPEEGTGLPESLPLSPMNDPVPVNPDLISLPTPKTAALPVPPRPVDPLKTQVADAVAPQPQDRASRGKTRVVQQRPRGSAGKIVGVLTTFTHHPNGQAFLIRSGRNVIGSSANVQIRVADDSVSEKHAIIMANDEKTMIDDCLSTNGTRVNQQMIEEKTPLEHGDVVHTGNTCWRFVRIEAPDESNG